MSIPQEAIDAAAEALFEASQELDQDNSWDDPLPDEWRESWKDAAREAIEAAMPHLRKQIVEELRNHPECSWHGLADGMENAADIVEGKP